MTRMQDLEEQLKKQRKLAEEDDAKRRAERLNLPYLDLISIKVPTEIKAMQLVPEAKAREAFLVPLQLVQKKIVVAVFNPEFPLTAKLLEELKKQYEVEIAICSQTGLEHGWGYYQYVVEGEKEISGRVDIDPTRLQAIQEKTKILTDLKNEIQEFKSPLTSHLLEIILGGSMALRASDIHMEPNETSGALRLRIDGILHAATQDIVVQTYKSLVTRVKLLSNLKINIHDQPQDGRFTIGLADRNVEIRTSVIPSEYGETIVMRLLDPAALKVNLEELGWRPDDLEIVYAELKKPNGLILNTGPTGSGKTTTLYAFLKYIFSPEIKIITVEDPIEYHIAGISQTQVDTDANYTFASGLRSILRQDPDVILVGEIRDQETADIAMNASLTGHLVFSTLHTNDAVGAIPRLLDLGVKAQTLGPALTLVIAQRLVRKLCPLCKVLEKTDASLEPKIAQFLSSLQERAKKHAPKDVQIYSAKGCPACGGLGYKGRISIFELFQVTEKIEEAIYANPTEIQLKKLSHEQQMTTMQEDGVLKVFQGMTTFQEVIDVTGPISWL